MKRDQTINTGEAEEIVHQSCNYVQCLQLLVLLRKLEDKANAEEEHEAWRLVNLCSNPSTLTSCQLECLTSALTSICERTRRNLLQLVPYLKRSNLTSTKRKGLCQCDTFRSGQSWNQNSGLMLDLMWFKSRMLPQTLQSQTLRRDTFSHMSVSCRVLQLSNPGLSGCRPDTDSNGKAESTPSSILLATESQVPMPWQEKCSSKGQFYLLIKYVAAFMMVSSGSQVKALYQLSIVA